MAVRQALFGDFNDEIMEFLASGPTPEQIIAFRPSPEFQRRASELLELNRSGQLSSRDRDELDELVRLEDFMRILKAKSRKHINP